MHTEQHPKSGQTITLTFRAQHPQLPEEGQTIQFQVEDWWDRMTGGSWMYADGNPAAMVYAFRAGMSPQAGIPIDDEVVYGHDEATGFGHLVHVIEFSEGAPQIEVS